MLIILAFLYPESSISVLPDLLILFIYLTAVPMHISNGDLMD